MLTAKQIAERDRKTGSDLESKAKAKAKAEPTIEIELDYKCWDDDGKCHPAGSTIKMSKTAAKKLIEDKKAHIPIPDDDD